MSGLKNLSPIDFEDLCRDIAYAETGLRYSAFSPGPDGGIDGRHSKSGDNRIIQCKHYIGSSFSNLKSTARREADKLSQINPSHYLFFTSQPLTPARSDELALILGSNLKCEVDIWGQKDIEDALRRHPDVEKHHLKLWLSSTAVLERILQSGLESYIQATKDEIREELKVYVQNKSFNEAIDKLDEEKILIISGSPGVGKTTLAKMISYYYLNNGWSFVAIRSLDEGFVKINDNSKTIFYFDDFLGRVKLNEQALLQHESTFSAFVNRIKKSENARFILTTRAHVFEEARLFSDCIDDGRLQPAKYLLDVGHYSRKIKSQIFFNHLSASKLTQEHFQALLGDNWLKKVIDHKNYNPRIIASISSQAVNNVEPNKYPKYIIDMLESPDLIWDKPYRKLELRSQNLLVSLFFENEYNGQSIERLKIIFSKLHRKVSFHYGKPIEPLDFENSLRSLESGFIAISGEQISLINPSLRDFLRGYLVDEEFLLLLPSIAIRANWALELWRHVQKMFQSNNVYLSSFAREFLTCLDDIISSERTMHDESFDILHEMPAFDGLDTPILVQLLFEWWQATREQKFLNDIPAILQSRQYHTDMYTHSDTISRIYSLIYESIDDNNPLKENLVTLIANSLIKITEDCTSVEELVEVIANIQKYIHNPFPPPIRNAIEARTSYMLNTIKDSINEIDDETDLSEYIGWLVDLAFLTGHDATRAIKIVEDRIMDLSIDEEDDDGLESKSYSFYTDKSDEERFDDLEIHSLFSNLLR